MTEKPTAGSVGWLDLTIPDADGLKDFYAAVVGWSPMPLSMGDYSDYVMMNPESGTPAAGVCHARGVNASLPPVWIPYFVVADLIVATDAIQQRGGTLLGPVQSAGNGKYVAFRDPAGAVAAVFQSE